MLYLNTNNKAELNCHLNEVMMAKHTKLMPFWYKAELNWQFNEDMMSIHTKFMPFWYMCPMPTSLNNDLQVKGKTPSC